uniref:NR LBD domain-containing protein n=1 Tax=Caenorhabditis tropicalis TaxID=1561998 RepID=A0A1I7UF03_9PELO
MENIPQLTNLSAEDIQFYIERHRILRAVLANEMIHLIWIPRTYYYLIELVAILDSLIDFGSQEYTENGRELVMIFSRWYDFMVQNWQHYM